MSLFEKIRIVIKEENAEDSKKSKAQNYTDKINRKNKNRKEFQFDPKTKERQTFKGKITSGPQKGQGYTIFRRDGGDVKKGVDKGVIPKAAKGSPIEVKSPAHKDLFKRYNKGEPKATQFMIDLGKDDRKARGLGKRAERVKDASGGKKTGSLRKGNLSFPGDRTGAYSRTKAEIEFNKALKKARGNTEGDLPKEAPQDVVDYAKKVRDKRIKKYKLPDTSFDSKTKFSQKQFDKSIGGAKKPTSAAAPGLFGKGDTKGQANVKGMERKAFKKTKPSDIKLPNTFTDFSKKLRRLKSDIQDVKDKDIATMRTGKSSSKVKVSGADNLTRQDVGMAPPDTPKIKKSTPQKGVSAIETTKKYNQEKNLKKFEKFRKEAETAKNRYRADVQKTFDNKSLTGSQKSTQTRIDMAKSRKAAELEKGYKLASQGKGNLTGGIVKSSTQPGASFLQVLSSTIVSSPRSYPGAMKIPWKVMNERIA